MTAFMNGNPIIAKIRKEILETLSKVGTDGMSISFLYNLFKSETPELIGRAISELEFSREIDFRGLPRVYYLIKFLPK